MKDRLQFLEEKLFQLEEEWRDCDKSNLDLTLPKQIWNVQNEINDILTGNK